MPSSRILRFRFGRKRSESKRASEKKEEAESVMKRGTNWFWRHKRAMIMAIITTILLATLREAWAYGLRAWWAKVDGKERKEVPIPSNHLTSLNLQTTKKLLILIRQIRSPLPQSGETGYDSGTPPPPRVQITLRRVLSHKTLLEEEDSVLFPAQTVKRRRIRRFIL